MKLVIKIALGIALGYALIVALPWITLVLIGLSADKQKQTTTAVYNEPGPQRACYAPLSRVKIPCPEPKEY